MLALGSEDKTITISNTEGDTIRQTTLRMEPSDLQFSEMKGDERSSTGENTVLLFLIERLKFYIDYLVYMLRGFFRAWTHIS